MTLWTIGSVWCMHHPSKDQKTLVFLILALNYKIFVKVLWTHLENSRYRNFPNFKTVLTKHQKAQIVLDLVQIPSSIAPEIGALPEIELFKLDFICSNRCNDNCNPLILRPLTFANILFSIVFDLNCQYIAVSKYHTFKMQCNTLHSSVI